MAFYAELKRKHWYCVNGWNAIRWYSDLLLQQWLESLSQEEKDAIERRRKEREERKHQELIAYTKALDRMAIQLMGRDNYSYYLDAALRARTLW